MISRKWHKVKLGHDLGLTKPVFPGRDLVRHDIENWKDCFDGLWKQHQEGKYNTLCVGLVSPEVTINNPLFKANNEEELETIKSKIDTMDKKRFCEIWSHQFLTTENSLWGRQRFVTDDFFPRIVPSCVELLNNNIGREINNYPNANGGYVRLSKQDKSYPFKVDEVLVNDPHGKFVVDSVDTVCKHLARFQKPVIEFGKVLKAVGAKSFSADFAYIQELNKLYFFDWDTGDDKKVIDNLVGR